LTILVRHTGIVVQDIEGAIDFWVGLLGFSVKVDQNEKGPFIDNLLGSENVEVRTVKLSDGISMIELLHFQSSSKDFQTPVYSPFNSGITHIALTVPDILGLLARLKEFGYRPICEPQISADGNVFVVYIPTFEGILLEIVQPILEN
jgi:catechol 2,3-dioxygenase-like lactoylglutathione lyase family enzyme